MSSFTTLVTVLYAFPIIILSHTSILALSPHPTTMSSLMQGNPEGFTLFDNLPTSFLLSPGNFALFSLTEARNIPFSVFSFLLEITYASKPAFRVLSLLCQAEFHSSLFANQFSCLQQFKKIEQAIVDKRIDEICIHYNRKAYYSSLVYYFSIPLRLSKC